MLRIVLKPEQMRSFFPLLQQGVGIMVTTGCSLEDLLCSQWGIDAGYVASRITTIFLNNRAIDNLATAIITPGSVLALSGAMPGLVGATMRRGGFYAAMRGAMTYQTEPTAPVKSAGMITVKLFNLLLPELGPLLVRHGVILDGARLAAFFGGCDLTFWQGCLQLRLNEQALDCNARAAQEQCGRYGALRLSVAVGEAR